MIYLTRKDVLGRIKESNLDIITEGDDSLLTAYELDATSVVSSYLSHDYDTSAVFMPLETENYVMHPTIKRMTIDIMLYDLHTSRVNPRNIPENIVQKRDEAVIWLKDVANPKTNTNADFLPKKQFAARRNNIIAWGSNEKSSHKY